MKQFLALFILTLFVQNHSGASEALQVTVIPSRPSVIMEDIKLEGEDESRTIFWPRIALQIQIHNNSERFEFLPNVLHFNITTDQGSYLVDEPIWDLVPLAPGETKTSEIVHVGGLPRSGNTVYSVNMTVIGLGGSDHKQVEQSLIFTTK